MPADDPVSIAEDMQRRWEAAFSVRDIDGLAALYADDVAFWGATPTLHTGGAGIRDYFTALPASYRKAEFATPHIVRLGPDAFAASGLVLFGRDGESGNVDLVFRMTQVFVRQDGGWKIAVHHASPRPG